LKFNRQFLAALLGLSVAFIWTVPTKAEEAVVFVDEGIVDTDNDFMDEPVLMPVTAYIEKGKPTVTGCTKARGILAAKQEWLGHTAILYKIADDGGIGELIGIFPVEDIGYGKATGFGSSVFSGRNSAGDIELGMCIDMRCANYSECVEFLTETFVGAEYSRTGSAVYFQLIKADG
jgi:hypothetical protein